MCVLVALAIGCDGDGGAPGRLLDGSPAAAPPVQLEGVGQPPVLTRVQTVPPSDVEPESPAHACLRHRGAGDPPAEDLVVRVGVAGESVTLRDASGLYGCDNSLGPREENRRWCGSAFGRLHRGRLRDPRLDIGCVTSDGSAMAFVWVEPAPPSRYVVVSEPDYAEVYEVAGGLPVRVAATHGASIERSRASFELSEHDSAGAIVRRYQLEAVVAG